MASWLVYSSPDLALPACVAAVSFPFLFRRRDRTRKQARWRAKECVWGEKKIGKKWGWGGWGERRQEVGVGRLPPPLLLIFCTRSQFRSLCVLLWKLLLSRLMFQPLR